MKKLLPLALILTLPLAACSSNKEYVKQDDADSKSQLASCEYEVELHRGHKDQDLINKCMESHGFAVKQ